MKVYKNTKSVDYSSSILKKSQIPYKKAQIIKQLKIINIVDKRKIKKNNLNLSSDRSFDKLEIRNSQEILKSKTPKNIIAQKNNNNIMYNLKNNKINSDAQELTNNINYIKANRDNSYCKSNYINGKNNNNINNNRLRIETDFTEKEFNFNKYKSTKSVLKKPNIDKDQDNLIPNNNLNINNNSNNISLNNQNFGNNNFNLFLKPKICVNIINNNTNHLNNLNGPNSNTNIFNNSSRKVFNKSLSTDRQGNMSIDFGNTINIKKNQTKVQSNEKTNCNIINTNESMNNLQNIIDQQIANSIVKDNMAYPMSPQIHKSNLLDKYFASSNKSNDVKEFDNAHALTSNKAMNSALEIQKERKINQQTSLSNKNNFTNITKLQENNLKKLKINLEEEYKNNYNSYNNEFIASNNTSKNKQTGNILMRNNSHLSKIISSPKDKEINWNDFYNFNQNQYNHSNPNNKNLVKEKNTNNNIISGKFYKINYYNSKPQKYTIQKNIPLSPTNINSNIMNYVQNRQQENKSNIHQNTNNQPLGNEKKISRLKNLSLQIQKIKSKKSNYLNSISKALLSKQSPKEIDKNKLNLEFLVGKSNINMNNHTKNNFFQDGNIINNQIDIKNFQKEEKLCLTQTELDKLHGNSGVKVFGDNLVTSDICNTEENACFNPLELNSEKDACLSEENYYSDDNHSNNFRRLEKGSNLTEEIHEYPKTPLSILKADVVISDSQKGNELLKCVETTLSSVDYLNISKNNIISNIDDNPSVGDNLNQLDCKFNLKTYLENKNINDKPDIPKDFKNNFNNNSILTEKIPLKLNLPSDGNADKLERNSVNNFKRRTNKSSLNEPKTTMFNYMNSHNNSNTNKNIEVIIENKKIIDNKRIKNNINHFIQYDILNKNESIPNIYKRIKTTNNSNNIPVHMKNNIFNNNTNNNTSQYNKANNNLIKEISFLHMTDNINNNQQIEKEIKSYNSNTNDNNKSASSEKKVTIDTNMKECNEPSHMISGFLSSPQAEKKSYGSDYIDTNVNNEICLAQMYNSDERNKAKIVLVNKYKIRKSKTQKDGIKEKQRDNENEHNKRLIDCPEELHLFYVNTIQQNKKLINEFD